jgi:hypothetical protein
MYTRKYDFQAGTRISSGQVDEEFNQIINALNDMNAKLSAAQLTKITLDDGGVKLNINDTTKDFLAEVEKLGKGKHTFYAKGGTKSLPSTTSFRGDVHFSTVGFGHLEGQDTNGVIYTNYLDNGVWQGWKAGGYNPQDELWTGTYFMMGDQIITPSKKLSECRNGWELIWSDYDPGQGSNDYDFSCSTTIPKYMAEKFSNKAILANIPNFLSDTASTTINKRLYVTDSTLKGHDDNNKAATNTNDVVLRAILEY